ncbi:hypothetical protein BDR26DRAFT_855261 [Obelidium mucronatum]|nr:hypothetical protein BDR26DRAFT_855261 [Obelidium mucronatum]
MITFAPAWITRINCTTLTFIAILFGLPELYSADKTPDIQSHASLMLSIAAVILTFVTSQILKNHLFAFNFTPMSERHSKYFDSNPADFDGFVKWIHFEQVAASECLMSATILSLHLLFLDQGSMELVPLCVRVLLWGIVAFFCVFLAVLWYLFKQHTELYDSIAKDV